MGQHVHSMPANAVLLRAVKRFRRAASWVVIVVLFALLSVSVSAWPVGGIADQIMTNLGFILLVICAFGRVWSSVFIAGYKNEKLITVGPYSLVRNPLYVFSFCGAIGIGLVCCSLTVVALLVLPFLVWYPIMVTEEEQYLADRHPEEWAAYAKATPRFIPALRWPVQPESYTVNTRKVTNAFADAIWFPISALAIKLALKGIAELHAAGHLPTIWHLY